MVELKQPIPIGTVVNVKGTPVDLMIVSQYPVTTINGVDGYFEFGAVALSLLSGEPLTGNLRAIRIKTSVFKVYQGRER